jgi:hypothetical protein
MQQMDLAWEGALVGMQKSIDTANRAVSEWSETAYNYFVDFAKQSTKPFMTEEVVKKFVEDGYVAAPNNCAWGSVALKASKRRIVEKVGFDYCKLGKGHTKPMTLWKYIGDNYE